MKDHHELAMEQFAKSATWMQQTGGYAKDMTLRDYFAGLAMQTFIRLHEEALTEDGEPCFWGEEDDTACKVISEQAYAVADAMLKEYKQ